MAEPPEGLNTSDIEKEVAEVPLVNGNHVEEEKLVSSPDVIYINCVYKYIYISSIAWVSA